MRTISIYWNASNPGLPILFTGPDERGGRGKNRGQGDARAKAFLHPRGRQMRRQGQIVNLGPVQEKKERPPFLDPAHRPGAAWKAIKVSAPHSHSMQLLQAPPGSFLQFARFPELDRVGGACLGAGGGSPGHGFDPPRAVEITTQSRFLIPFSSASSGGISANPAGCSSAVEGTIRVGMAPPNDARSGGRG
jgi:hypothetical protein